MQLVHQTDALGSTVGPALLEESADNGVIIKRHGPVIALERSDAGSSRSVKLEVLAPATS